MKLIKRYRSVIHGNYRRASLLYGLYTGLALSALVIFRRLIIYPLSQPVTYVENVALLVLMFLFLWRYRKNLEEQKVSFREGYLVCFGLGIVSAVVYGIFIYVYAWKIDPNMQVRCYNMQRALENNVKLPDEAVRAMTTPSSIAMSAVLLTITVSIIFAMVAALMLRNEKSEIRTKQTKL
ncbi:MAG: DUF4199 domain-containing protein [Bacteroidales bacterium]|jgi:hypothetical protein|nr:DUF4199 domain-containing protein [Bacteroidales bacterium]